MEEPQRAPQDESWRIETREERHARIRDYARRDRRRLLWLTVSAILLILVGMGGGLLGLGLRAPIPQAKAAPGGSATREAYAEHEAEPPLSGPALFVSNVGLAFFLLVPVGLLRLIAVAIEPGEPWTRRWRVRRALYRHPFLKFLALLAIVGALVPLCSALRSAAEEGTSTSSHEAGGRDSGTDEHGEEALEAVGDFLGNAIAMIILFGIGLALLFLSFGPGALEAPI